MDERWIEADGLRVHAVEWRPERSGGGRPVLLVHGLGGHTVSWEPVGPGLADRLGATVTAVDLGGFGRTRLPRGRHATVAANGRLVRTLLEDEIGPAVVFGNSMGGAIGVGLAARRPDLVRALVLVDPALPRWSGGVPPWRAVARLAPLAVPALGARVVGFRARRLGPERLVDTSLVFTLVDPKRLDPGTRERMIELATERATYPEGPASYADAARSLFLYLQRRMSADLRAVQCPTLVVHGELDQLVPVRDARALASRRADFEVVEFDDCGHVPQLECPGRFLDTVVPWLARQEATTADA